MPLLFNIRHLEDKDLELEGDLPASDLELESVDQLIRLPEPLHNDLGVQKLGEQILAQGSLDLTLHCECARCLKPFKHEISLPGWAAYLPLEGEEKVKINNDFVDLTPYI